MEAIILAGGKGTRLASRLVDCPKPMVSIAGRPFLEWLLEELARQGFHRAILSVGHLRQVIQDHFRSAFAGMAIDYVVEEEPLGTGGAIRAALPAATSDPVFVLNGDTYLLLDYRKMRSEHIECSRSFTMAVVHQQNAERYGNVLLGEDTVVGFRERGTAGPGWINGGVYLVNKALCWPPHLSTHFSFETDFLVPNVLELQPGFHRCDGYFIDIGVPEDLDRAEQRFSLASEPFHSRGETDAGA